LTRKRFFLLEDSLDVAKNFQGGLGGEKGDADATEGELVKREKASEEKNGYCGKQVKCRD